jgi:hypothetical protein
VFLSEVSNSYWVLQKLGFKEGPEVRALYIYLGLLSAWLLRNEKFYFLSLSNQQSKGFGFSEKRGGGGGVVEKDWFTNLCYWAGGAGKFFSNHINLRRIL